MHALEIKNLSKTYPTGVQALKNINLIVEKGDFFALLGPNGAGKSTTISLIATLLTPTSGSILIHGYDLKKQATLAKFFLGLVPQEINLDVFKTCMQVLQNQAGYYGLAIKHIKPHIEYLLHELGLWEKRFSQVRYLSGGMKRRLMIARALIHQPKLLILDEPTAGVDVELRHQMWDFLTETNRNGTTIILTTHYLEEAERLCKNVAIIDKGQIIAHASMPQLLKTVHHRTYILTVPYPLSHNPNLSCAVIKPLTSHSFEIRMQQNVTLNQLFSELAAQEITIINIQNKTNQLEELFLDLTGN